MNDLIDIGVYTGLFRSVEVGKSANTGTTCVQTTWHIEEKGVDRTVYTYITKNSMRIAFKKLEGVGFNGDFNDPAVSVEKTELRCTHSTYEGKTREKWEYASWGSNIDELDTNGIRELNALWKKEKASAGSAGATKKPSPAPAKPATKAAPAAKPATAAKPAAPAPEKAAAESAPAEPETAAPKGGGTPREGAWASFVEYKASPEAIEGLESGKSAKATMEWAQIISEAVPGKEEEDFNEDDWENVRQYCEVPY